MNIISEAYNWPMLIFTSVLSGDQQAGLLRSSS